MLYLHLGTPKVGSLLSDDINEVAINYEITHEAAVIKCFDVLVTSLGKHDSGGATYFDLLMCECFQKKMSAPKITLKTHGEGIRLPMLAFETDSALHEPTGQHLPITNQMLNYFGEMFAEDFDVEYLGYETVGSQITRLRVEKVISPSEMIYMINGKPHIYTNGHFVPAQE